MSRKFYNAFLNALCISAVPGQVTRMGWYAECVRTGLAAAINTDDTSAAKDRKQSKFRKYVAELKAANLIGVDGDVIFDLGKRS